MVHAGRALFAALVTGAALTALAGCAGDRTDPDRAAPPAPTTTAYRDGTYTATGWYGGAPSHVDVTVTLADGTITAARVTPQPVNNPTSRDYQERFAAAAPALVVGRPVDQVALDHVAGSSGTPDGFNDALAKIRDQAAVR